jgi:hypothetical protein
MDVQPVSDPNIFSEAQRFAQNQAAFSMAEKFPQVFKVDILCRRALALMNFPAYEEVLNAPQEPKELDALTENIVASEPESQLKAFPQQDHMMHLKSHIAFAVSPIFCANPLMGIPTLPKLLAHIKEHLLALYKDHVRAASQIARYTLKPQKEGEALVQGQAFADQELAKELAPLMPLLEQAQQLAQKLMPKPPGDPRSAAQLQIAEMKTKADAEQKDKDRQLTAGLAQADMQVAEKENQQQNMLEVQRQSAENARSTQEMDVARENAQHAVADTQADRQMEAILAMMREEAATARQSMAEQTKLQIAGMSQDFQSYQDNVNKQFETMRQMLEGHKEMAQSAIEREEMVEDGEAQRAHELELADKQAKAAKAGAPKS